MTWILVYIVLTLPTVEATNIGTFDSLNECFEVRDMVVSIVGWPIVNYQVICIQKKEA